MHTYVDCEVVVSGEENHHIFRVRTDVGLVFLFQVSDDIALKRWIKWFTGGAAVDGNTTNKVTAVTEDQQVPPLDQPSRPQMQTATFGVGNSSVSVSHPGVSTAQPSVSIAQSSVSIAQPSVAAYSSFYSTNVLTNSQQQSQINNESFSVLHGQSMLSVQSEQPMGASNSFGIVDSSWQRYP